MRTILAHMCVCNRKIYWPYFQYVGSKWTFRALHAHWWSSVICDLFRGGRWMVPLRTFCWIWNNGNLLFELLFCHACTCTEDVKLWKLWDIIENVAVWYRFGAWEEIFHKTLPNALLVPKFTSVDCPGLDNDRIEYFLIKLLLITHYIPASSAGRWRTRLGPTVMYYYWIFIDGHYTLYRYGDAIAWPAS